MEQADGLIPSTRAAAGPSSSSSTRKAITSRSAGVSFESARSRSADRPSASGSIVRARLGQRIRRLPPQAPLLGAKVVERRRARHLAEPRLHAPLARVVAAPEAKRALEDVTGQLLGQAAVARHVDEVGQDVLQMVFRRSGEGGHAVHTPPAASIVTDTWCCRCRRSASPRPGRTARSSRRPAASVLARRRHGSARPGCRRFGGGSGRGCARRSRRRTAGGRRAGRSARSRGRGRRGRRRRRARGGSARARRSSSRCRAGRSSGADGARRRACRRAGCAERSARSQRACGESGPQPPAGAQFVFRTTTCQAPSS